jgi:hypothetical protein
LLGAKSGEAWSKTQRELWLGVLKDAFKLIYKDAPVANPEQ